MPDASPPEPTGLAARAPVPLRVAAALVAVEGLALAVLGVLEVISLDGDRLTMGLTVTVFFWAFGGLLLVAAWGLGRLRPLARGPVLLAQLIGLGLAWNFRHGSTLPVAVGLAAVALAVLAGLLHPRSIEALERAADRL